MWLRDRSRAQTHPAPIIVAALYKFMALPNFDALRQPILQACQSVDVCGTLLLAPEGINGTIAGSRAGIDAALNSIRELLNCTELERALIHL